MQARSQHTPSTQMFDAHWVPTPQACPLANFGTHTPPAQNSRDAQSPSSAQSPQLTPEHVNGLQACVCNGGQVPVPVQKPRSVATSLVQPAARHSIPASG
jgi:hypothetical protein